MKKNLQKILPLLCLILMQGFAFGEALQQGQSINVTGKVTGADNQEGLPGVSIVVKGTSFGTMTDANGEYSIEVPSGDAVLVFSFISYLSQEIRVNQQTVINVTLQADAQILNEVVVAGAVIKQSDLTGAVSRINGEQLAEIPTASMLQAITGRMTGVLIQNNAGVSGDASIRIRGNNSIMFSGNPIFVVDGLIIDGGLNLVNPNDIETIDVLKDASSTAIYGSRGANGVVIVTTKKGKKGKGVITYDGWYGVQEFSKIMPRLGAKDIYDLRIDARANQYMDANPGTNRQGYIDNILLDPASGQAAFVDYEFDTYNSGKSYNWLDEVIRSGAQQNHTVSFSKGTDEGSYYVSFNYTRNRGLMKNSEYERFSGKVNLEQNIRPWLKVGTNTTYSRSHEEYVQGGVFSIANGANPLLPINDEINYLKWASLESPDHYNPVRSLTIDGDGYQTRLMSSNYININPIKNLNIRSTYSIDLWDRKDLWYTPRNIGQSVRNATEGTAQHRNDHWLNWQWDNTATYNVSFLEKHSLTTMVGFSMQQNTWDFNQVNAAGFISDHASYKYLNAAFNRDQFSMGSDFTRSSIVSFIGRLNYNYSEKYFATVTARYDGSSRLSPNNRWSLFPSLALGWSVSEENFFKNLNLNFISQLKLRGGYGQVGNQNIPNFGYQTLYYQTISGGSAVFKHDGNLGNENLMWEKQKQLNIGLDVGLLNDRLVLAAEYFSINNSDLLMRRSLSQTTNAGFTTAIANVGALENKGIEFSATANIINKSDLKWNVSANISSAKNRITRLFENVEALYNLGGWTGVELQREGNLFLGQSINSIYTFKFDKIAQESDMDRIATMDLGGRIVRPGDILPYDKTGDGIINDDDRYVVGTKDPKFYGGFSTDITYKGIGLNAVFTYNYGAKRISYLYEGMMNGSGMSAAHEDMLNRWTPTNTNTNIPRAYNGGGRYGVGDVSWGIQDASFLRLSTMTLSYTLPSSMMQKAKMNSVRVYFTGSNLFVATKYKGYDPEGGDSYPMSRMYVTGINVSF